MLQQRARNIQNPNPIGAFNLKIQIIYATTEQKKSCHDTLSAEI
jgi:hypothetical protein